MIELEEGLWWGQLKSVLNKVTLEIYKAGPDYRHYLEMDNVGGIEAGHRIFHNVGLTLSHFIIQF